MGGGRIRRKETAMGKYLVLYNSPISADDMMANSTPEEMKAGMDAWNTWGAKVGDALVDFGLPLGSSKRVEGGSMSPGSSQATGYSFIQAQSLEAATKLLEDHPHLHQPGSTIDVLETREMPGT
jgi:hypothetical protein